MPGSGLTAADFSEREVPGAQHREGPNVVRQKVAVTETPWATGRFGCYSEWWPHARLATLYRSITMCEATTLLLCRVARFGWKTRKTCRETRARLDTRKPPYLFCVLAQGERGPVAAKLKPKLSILLCRRPNKLLYLCIILIGIRSIARQVSVRLARATLDVAVGICTPGHWGDGRLFH